MLECLIVGDSIAVGTQMHRPECVLVGRGGINSWQFNKHYAQQIKPAGTVIISLGSNDHRGVRTAQELAALRQRVQGNRVFWIFPAGNLKAGGVDISTIQHTVREIAQQYGDTVLPITQLQPDGIHPSTAGYRSLASGTK